MFAIDPTMLQNYVREKIVDHFETHCASCFHAAFWVPFYYEFTVTYNPCYWTKHSAMQVVPQVVADVLKPIIRTTDGAVIMIRYSVEYHQNGYPHVHGQVLMNGQGISPDIQRSIHQRLCRRYGKSQWYQTESQDKFHETSGMLWSEYIQKDVAKNSSSGLRHYYEYCVRI